MSKVKISRSRLCALTVVLGTAVLGISADIQGAARKVSSTSREVGKLSGVGALEAVAPIRTPQSAAGLSTSAWMERLKQVPGGGYPIFEPQVVDYRNDEPSRLRRAGLLVGALPIPKGLGLLATGHTLCPVTKCTFDIDCDDGDPCTTDTCDIPPEGPVCDGNCVNTQVGEGLPGGCDDGLFCNGREFCDAGGNCASGVLPACCVGTPDEAAEECSETLAKCSPESEVAGRRCVQNADCPGGTCDHCVALCVNDADCDDGFGCNGTETCDAGICRADDPPCGSGASCFEKRCIGASFLTPCVNADDCPGGEVCGNKICSGFGGGACDEDSDCGAGRTCGSANVCRTGRCCPQDAKVDDCLVRDSDTCFNVVGGSFFAGDNGADSGDDGECGSTLPLHIGGGRQLGCPSYTSGIVQTSIALPVHPVIAGPISFSEVPVPNPGGPGGSDGLHRIGDDYCINVVDPTRDHVAIEAVRFVGAMAVPDTIFLEFWDNDGNFIEDALVRPSSALGVNVLFLAPPIIVPPCGSISARTKIEFEPDARFVWASTDVVNEGTNDPTILFVNDAPNFSVAASGMLGGNPAILSFELAGRPVVEPRGGCCHVGTVACTNEVQWICETDGKCNLATFQCEGSINAGTPCLDDADCTGVFQGIGSFCATCEGGENAGAPCQTCSGDKLCTINGTTVCTVDDDCSIVGGGTCEALLCDSNDDCADVGGTCEANNDVCSGGDATCSNNDEVSCTDDAQCPPRAAICSNSLVSCVADVDCPGGSCGGAGSCAAGVCEILLACATGACCAEDGGCLITSPGTCTGTFQGEGTTCEPNCCLQPDAVSCSNAAKLCSSDADCPAGGTCGPTGKDHCEDVVIDASNTIGILQPNDPPVVLTFTGNNSLATAVADIPGGHPNGDSCFGVATTTESDGGWWEGFRLTDTCTRVRIDLCCTTPTAFASWPWLTRDCACSDLAVARLDPNTPELQPSALGKPFCAEDNLWNIMGLLGPGTYYYSIRSALQGTLGPYTFHVVAAPCALAACCTTAGDCVNFTNLLECNALGGFFLGAPNKFPATAICLGPNAEFPDGPSTCGTGSCCFGPGDCEDQNNGIPFDLAQCIADGGTFVGGIRCKGGFCATDTSFSCAGPADCVGDGLPGCPAGTECCLSDGGQRSLDQPNPCPICEFESIQNCQRFDSGRAGQISDLNFGGIIHADDFVAGAALSEVDQVCVWGSYTTKDSRDPNPDCSSRVASDNFRVRIFEDNGFGVPGTLLGESRGSSVKVEIDDGDITFAGIARWGFQITLDTTITGLVANETYWLEVANDLSDESNCFWSWSLISSDSPDGNNHNFGGSTASGYRVGGEGRVDAAWCLPGAVSAPPTPVRASCSCAGGCLEQDLATASIALNSFKLDAVDQNNTALECSQFVCPADGTPSNDDFANALEVPVGFFTYETYCASTDSTALEETEQGVIVPVVLDVWYRFKARQDCQLLVSQCASPNADAGGFDAILGLYTNGDLNCNFDPTIQTGADFTRVHQSGLPVLSDEDCCPGLSCGGGGFITVPAMEGQCFIIRAAAFGGQGNERGRGIINISCGDPICGDGTVNRSGEECDGDDLGICDPSAACTLPDPHSPGAGCKCAVATCGNGLVEGLEECDPPDDAACPAMCNAQCECDSVCGNGRAEPGEDCDGNDADDCPGRCQPDCTCPAKFCGNDFKDPSEECDGTDDARCPSGICRTPNDPAGGCTCACEPDSVSVCPCDTDVNRNGNTNQTDLLTIIDCVVDDLCVGCTDNCDVNCDGSIDFIDFGVVLCRLLNPIFTGIDCCAEPVGACFGSRPLQCMITLEPTCTTLGGVYLGDGTTCPVRTFDRALEIVIPASSAGTDTAYRVTLVSLYHPSFPPPLPVRDLSARDGEVRYLNLFGDSNGAVVTDCVSSAASGTTYPCITVGCEPEFADWGTLFSGRTAYVSGNAIIPNSVYTVEHLDGTCTVANAGTCPDVLARVQFMTARYGDVQPDGLVTVADVVLTVDAVKQLPGSAFEYQVYIRKQIPTPQIDSTNVGDIVSHVDALKLFSYALPLDSCP